MTARVLLGWVVAAAVAAGCGAVHPPVTVLGDARALAGVWEGTYESPDTGRAGALTFALSAAGDSAVGEVVMVPRGEPAAVRWDGEAWQWRGVARAQVLPIRFVQVRGGTTTGGVVEVVGELEPYRDPDCGCALRTVFRGVVAGDAVTGTFASSAGDPFHDAEGTWAARRRSGP